LDQLAGYLASHPEVWTATFGDVVRYIQESQALGIHQAEYTARAVQFELSWPLDPRIFNLPLTLKWQLPNGSTSCAAAADGKPLAVKNNGSVMFLDIPPQTKLLRFSCSA
jgi:hypothetical protein